MQSDTVVKKRRPGDVLLLCLAVAGLLVFVRLYSHAFPTASIDLKVSRSQAQQIAASFLSRQGFRLAGYDTAQSFAADELAAAYLQKTQGMEKANQWMRTTVPVWFWRCRWFKPLQKEEFHAAVDPTGKLLGFTRILDEDKPGANLSQAAAARMAEAFLRNALRLDLSAYERIEASSTRRKNRTDHDFVWKKKGFQIGAADLRIAVQIQGDQVGAVHPFLKVPERFARRLDQESSVGQLLALVSVGFMVLLCLAALAILIAKAIARDIRWKFAGVSAVIVLVLTVAGVLNSFPLLKAQYPTQIPYAVFLGTAVVAAILGGILYGVFILLTGAAGDALAREVYPGSIAVLSDLIHGKIATRELAAAVLRGYGLAFSLVGYLVLFYLIGRRFVGVWVAADSPYSNMLDTAVPFLYPLLIGVTAAISEEFTFRLFGISLVKKYLKVTFLALLVPAVIWAFGHSNYPVLPVYFRGIELTIAGLIFGCAFLRWGLVTCLVAHYVLDALLVALPLLRSSHSSFALSGVGVVGLALLPVIPGLVGWLRPATPRPVSQPAASQG